MQKMIKIHDSKGMREIPFNNPQPITQATNAYAMFERLMDSAQTLHTATPVDRGVAMLIKSTAITLFLSFFTVAALIGLDMLGFFLWLGLASLEWVVCFIILAVLDWREHPSAIRWNIANGVLFLMQREQDARFISQGIDPKEIDG